MHLAVTINGEIYHAEINSDEIGRRDRRDFRRLNAHEQKPLAVEGKGEKWKNKMAFSRKICLRPINRAD
jgi:hypothetical protein